MVLDSTSIPPHERSERSERSESIYLLPSLLHCMDKAERKLIKLQSKAQECVSRKKAQKILLKAKKWQKCLKSYPIENHSQNPHSPLQN